MAIGLKSAGVRMPDFFGMREMILSEKLLGKPFGEEERRIRSFQSLAHLG